MKNLLTKFILATFLCSLIFSSGCNVFDKGKGNHTQWPSLPKIKFKERKPKKNNEMQTMDDVLSADRPDFF